MKIAVRSGSVTQINQITRLKITNEIEISEADVQELLDLCQPYTGGTGPLLIVLPQNISISFPAMKFAAQVDGVPYIALLTAKPRLIEAINIVLQVMHRFGMRSQMRWFRDESKAIDWLIKKAA